MASVRVEGGLPEERIFWKFESNQKKVRSRLTFPLSNCSLNQRVSNSTAVSTRKGRVDLSWWFAISYEMRKWKNWVGQGKKGAYLGWELKFRTLTNFINSRISKHILKPFATFPSWQTTLTIFSIASSLKGAQWSFNISAKNLMRVSTSKTPWAISWEMRCGSKVVAMSWWWEADQLGDEVEGEKAGAGERGGIEEVGVESPP